MSELLNCLVCGSTDLTNYLNLGEQPLANSFSEEPSAELPKFPLRVNYCSECSHSQLSELVDPEILFKDYLFVSGTSQTRRNHFADLARDCYSRLHLAICPSVLSIGCNDATDLEAFRSIGFMVRGCDPAENLRPISQGKGIDVEVDYWNAEVSERLGIFDVVFGCNVFAHNPNPLGFLKACKSSLKDDGIIVIEFPLFTNTIINNDLGQIYHEHLSYFTIKSMATLVSKAGLGIVDIVEFPNIDGGAIRVIIKDVPSHENKILNMIQTEKVRGFHSLGTYEGFAEKILMNLKLLISCIQVQKMIGYNIVGYGAAAKTSTIFNTVPGLLDVDYIVDDAPMKVDRFIPSTRIPIKPTSELSKNKGLIALVLFAHNYKEEILRKVKGLRQGSGDIVINMVPSTEVEDL